MIKFLIKLKIILKRKRNVILKTEMLSLKRRQLICVIMLAINVNIILGFFYNRLYAQESESKVKEEKRFSNEELTIGQYKDCNLIVISLGNLGARHMSLYGYQRKTTPNLDKWAHDAMVFENVFSPASWTLPVATSLFSSLCPYTHKIFNRDIQNTLNKSIKTLPEILRENNYKTAAFTGGLDYYKGFSHMRGFEYIDENPNLTGFEVTLAQAENWLSQNSDKKFFLFIHGYTTHSPFDPPKEFKGIFSNPKGKNITVDYKRSIRGFKASDNNTYEAYYAGGTPWFRGPHPIGQEKEVVKIILTQDDINYLRDLYDEEVLYEDFMIGKFLNSLDKTILNNTIIVVFSEHGEMFAKHGRFGRAGTIRGTLYDDVIHISLIIKLPERQDKRVNGLVQIIDIMPTIIDLLDIPSSQKIQGKSLLPLINTGKSVNEYVYAGLQFNVGKPVPQPPFYLFRSINESIRGRKWKLIREITFADTSSNTDQKIAEETFELYNLQDDPDELINLTDKHPNITKDLKERLSRWVKWSQGFASVYPSTQKIPSKLLEDARKHGYWE